MHGHKRNNVTRPKSKGPKVACSVGSIAKSSMVTRGKAAQLKERSDVHEVADILLSFAKLPPREVTPGRVTLPTSTTETASAPTPFPYSLFLLSPSSPLVPVLAAVPPPATQPMSPLLATEEPVTCEDESIAESSNLKPKNGISKKKRKRTTKAQLAILEKVFESNKTPNREAREELGRLLGMSPRSVQIWYQNRRSKLKRGVRPDKPIDSKILHKESFFPSVSFLPNLVPAQRLGQCKLIDQLPLLAPRAIKKEDVSKVEKGSVKLPCIVPMPSSTNSVSSSQLSFSSLSPCLNVSTPDMIIHTFASSSLVQVP